MSKYTTEVRNICLFYCGENNDEITPDAVINRSWMHIFTTKSDFFEIGLKERLCKKILKHYFMREICCETVGLWKLWLNERFEEILPKYNKLYEIEKIKIEPLVNFKTEKEATTSSNTSQSKTENDKKETENKNNSETTNTTNFSRAYSDTPQGTLNGVENNSYLTNYEKTNDDVHGSHTENQKHTEKTNNISELTGNGNEEIRETIKGFNGTTQTKMIVEMRENVVNLDKNFVSEFSDLFLGLW